MKNLKNYAVEVHTIKEKEIAFEFYKRASKYKVHPIQTNYARYVGLSAYFKNERSVLTGDILGSHETPVPFEKISQLADSPSRKKALKAARSKFASQKKIGYNSGSNEQPIFFISNCKS